MIRKMAPSPLMPKMAIEIGSQAVIGTGRSHWIEGSTRAATVFDQPISTPIGTPITMASANPAPTRCAEATTLSAHVPE